MLTHYVTKYIDSLEENKTSGIAMKGRTLSFIYIGNGGVINKTANNLYYHNGFFYDNEVTPVFTEDNSMKVADILSFVNKVDAVYMGDKSSSYREFLFSNNTWTKFYPLVKRNILYMAGVTCEEVNELTIACHECGIILPPRLIQIDHIKPQSGGRDQSIIKFLRFLNCGFVKESGSGFRYNALTSNDISQVPTKKDRGMKSIAIGDRVERYTLTRKGNIFLSVLLSACPFGIESYFIHTLLNAQPLCPSCNIKKTNLL